VFNRLNPEAEGEAEDPEFRRPIQQTSGAPRIPKHQNRAWKMSRARVEFYMSEEEEEEEEEEQEEQEGHEGDGDQGVDADVPYLQVNPSSSQFIPGQSSQFDTGPSQLEVDPLQSQFAE